MRRLLISCGRSVYKNKRGLIPSLFLYINRGSQGSDLGDWELRDLTRPDRHPTSLFQLFHTILYSIMTLFLHKALKSKSSTTSFFIKRSSSSDLHGRKRLKSRRAKLGEILISSCLAKPNYILIRYLKNGQLNRNFWTTHLGFTDRVDDLQPNQFVYLFSFLRSIHTKNQAAIIVSKSLMSPSLLHYQRLLLLLSLYTLSSMLP